MDAMNDRELERAIERCELRRIDPLSSEPTGAAAAIALDPVPIGWARSFHRLAWTEGGGPWMGVADSPPYAVVSTCHAAVDGYVHARVAAAILSHADGRESAIERATMPPSARLSPPAVGFAAVRVPGPPPRFADALHAFATVLDRRLGSKSGTSVPFHIPIAPGERSDPTRWRRRPLYGLLALKKNEGRLESREMLAARLPAWLARESSGEGVLSRVLHAVLTLPFPLDVRRRLIARQPWADRFLPPARILTGNGYFSWMRFPPGEEPSVPTYPSAIPSFSADRGGAGLSIAPYEGGLAVGLTTSGSLGTASAAEGFLDEWVDALRAE
jgi:hypothetical protein